MSLCREVWSVARIMSVTEPITLMSVLVALLAATVYLSVPIEIFLCRAQQVNDTVAHR